MSHPVTPDYTEVFSREPMSDAELLSWAESFAYELCGCAIEDNCVPVIFALDEEEHVWYDLASARQSVEDEVAYLHARRLLRRHAWHPHWVQICDEAEPMPAAIPAKEGA